MSFVADLAILTRAGLRAEVGRLRALSRGQRTGLAAVLLVMLGLITLAGLALWQAHLGPAAASAALTGGYLTAGVVLTAVGLPLGVAFLDERSDAPLLLTTPASPAAIVAARLASTAFWEGLLAVAILLPLTVGLGPALGAGPGYYLLSLALLPVVPILPLALGHGVAFLLLRAVPPRVVQTALGVAGALLGGVWAFARAGAGLGEQLAGGLGALAPLGWLPFGWPGAALAAWAAGDHARFLGLAGATLVAAGIAFACAAWLGAAIARRGWYDFVPRRGEARRKGGRLSFGAGPVGALLLKDWRITYRDPNVWTRLLGPLVFFGIIVWQVLANAAALEGPGGVPIKGLAVCGATVFLAWSLNNRLAITAFNRDRQAVVWTLVSPAPIERIVWAKLLAALLPQLAIVWPLALLLCWIERLPLLESAVQTAGTPLLLTLLAARTLQIATAFPKFDWRDARRVTPVQATLWVTVLHLAALAAAAALLVALPALGPAPAAAGLLALALLAAGAVRLVLTGGSRRVASWEIAG
ncbi:MAG: hypothetical protein U0556_14900 [Dehalococcoidia bacterium]